MSATRLPWVRQKVSRGQEDVEDELRRLDDALAQGIARQSRSLEYALRRGNIAKTQDSRLALESLLTEGQALKAMGDSIRVVLSPSASRADGDAAPLHEGTTTFWVSSSSLAQAYAHLTKRLPGSDAEPEWMLAASGLHIGSLRTLETLIEVRLGTQSTGRASFDMRHFTEVALSLMEHGQALHGIFHSHRFRGPPSPSGTDGHLQRVLAEGGYPAIQAVFSEDGYVRFFADRPFAIRVYGKGVVHVEGHLYRIVHFGTLPHPALAGRGVRAL